MRKYGQGSGRRAPREILAMVGTVGAVVLALGATAGCGGSDGPPKVASVEGGSGGGPSGAAAGDEIARSREFAQCMRDNGVAMEDPDPGTGELDFGTMRDGADSNTLRTALEACRDKAPQAIRKNTKPDPEMLESMRKFAQCMRDGGVPVNDPGPEGLGKPFPTDAPGFDAAMEKCQGLLRPGSGK